MKVLVQGVKNRLFLAADGNWAGGVENARDFDVTTLAYNFAVQNICGPFRVLLHMPASGELITFEIGHGRAARRGLPVSAVCQTPGTLSFQNA